MNDFFPEISAYDHFMLDVGNQHQLYVEQCGNPQGQPVVFLHGGPGGGCSVNDRRFFDPLAYRIILFDQRGCGRSKPFASLENNTTADLISDIELIRNALSIDKWHVFGGSWGSTLALVYAQSYPSRVSSLVLRGIFLARAEDTDWAFAGQGANRLFPDYWQEYINTLPEGSEPLLQRAYKALTSQDQDLAKRVARAWAQWEIKCCTLMPDKSFLQDKTDDKTCWTLARHECHYMINQCFLENNQILANCHKIQEIPTVIIHGRYDVICPLDNAWALSEKLPNAEFIISQGAGHASSESNTKHLLIDATNRMLAL